MTSCGFRRRVRGWPLTARVRNDAVELILASGNAESRTGNSEALAGLRRLYWRPIFAFVCRRGYSTQDAQDLTQDFFLMMLEGISRNARSQSRPFPVAAAQVAPKLPERCRGGKTRAQARRRHQICFVGRLDGGSALAFVDLGAEALRVWPAEKIYDVRWAATVVEQALRQLARGMRKSGPAPRV